MRFLQRGIAWIIRKSRLQVGGLLRTPLQRTALWEGIRQGWKKDDGLQRSHNGLSPFPEAQLWSSGHPQLVHLICSKNEEASWFWLTRESITRVRSTPWSRSLSFYNSYTSMETTLWQLEASQPRPNVTLFLVLSGEVSIFGFHQNYSVCGGEVVVTGVQLMLIVRHWFGR